MEEVDSADELAMSRKASALGRGWGPSRDPGGVGDPGLTPSPESMDVRVEESESKEEAYVVEGAFRD